MKITDHAISGVKIIEPAPRVDARGYFMRVWDKDILAQHGIGCDWLQENQALSVKAGTLRGLHFQRPPHAENKLVRCIAGRMLDVFVDLRKGSPSFGKWGSVELDAASHKMVLMPRGFAHGYLTLTDNCIACYRVDALYAPTAEGGLRWNDPAVGIPWPVKEPILSEKDVALPLLKDVAPVEL